MIRVIEVPEIPLQVQLAELTRNMSALSELKAGLSGDLAGLSDLFAEHHDCEVKNTIAHAAECLVLMSDREEALHHTIREVRESIKNCNQALVENRPAATRRS